MQLLLGAHQGLVLHCCWALTRASCCTAGCPFTMFTCPACPGIHVLCTPLLCAPPLFAPPLFAPPVCAPPVCAPPLCIPLLCIPPLCAPVSYASRAAQGIRSPSPRDLLSVPPSTASPLARCTQRDHSSAGSAPARMRHVVVRGPCGVVPMGGHGVLCQWAAMRCCANGRPCGLVPMGGHAVSTGSPACTALAAASSLLVVAHSDPFASNLVATACPS